MAKTERLLARATEQNKLLKEGGVETIKEEDEIINTEGDMTHLNSHKKLD